VPAVPSEMSHTGAGTRSNRAAGKPVGRAEQKTIKLHSTSASYAA